MFRGVQDERGQQTRRASVAVVVRVYGGELVGAAIPALIGTGNSSFALIQETSCSISLGTSLASGGM